MKDINIVKTLQLIKNYDIHTWVNFMLAAPQSTIEDDLNVIELSHAGDVTYTACSTTVPMNGTRLYDYSLNNNLIDSSYIGDMCDCSKRSPYKHFNEKEKDIRYNVWLLGPIASKLCFPFRQIVTFMIKHIKPNKLFSLVRDKYYKYSIENTIFKVK